mgnify:CR=1 FL=1
MASGFSFARDAAVGASRSGRHAQHHMAGLDQRSGRRAFAQVQLFDGVVGGGLGFLGVRVDRLDDLHVRGEELLDDVRVLLGPAGQLFGRGQATAAQPRCRSASGPWARGRDDSGY